MTHKNKNRCDKYRYIGLAIILASSLGSSAGFGQNSQKTSSAPEQLAIMTMPAHEVCAGKAYLNGHGERTVGTKNCQAKVCSKAGETGCLTTAEYRSLDVSALLPEQLVRGYSLGGVTGSFNPNAPKPAPCKSHGNSFCVSNATFPAVERAKVTAGNIVKGIAFPGMASGAFPSAQYPLPGFDRSLKMLTGSNLSSILQEKGTLQFWTITGNRQVVAIDVGLASENIPAGKMIHGIKGKMKRDTFPVCTKDGQYSCQVKQGYLAVKATDLLPENFRNGVKVSDSITGTYPSKRTPLANAREANPDLRSDTFTKLMAEDNVFEFFDRFGRRYTARGDSNVKIDHIKAGVSLWGTTGNFRGLATDEDFDEFDILIGHRVADMQGKLDPKCGQKGTCRQDYWVQKSFDNGGKATTCDGDTSKTCVFFHKITKLTWLFPPVGSTIDWSAATAICKGIGYKGGGWRLPTQKEGELAMTQGMKALPIHQRYSTKYDGSENFWTSTADGGGKRVYISPMTQTIQHRYAAHNGGVAYPACVR